MSQPSRVNVLVRCRPQLEHEQGQGTEALSVTPADGSIAVSSQAPAYHGAPSAAVKTFSFDAVLDGNAAQDDVYYAGNIERMCEAALDGYNATIFAYGQTGSGKTYTMEGYEYVKESEHDRPYADFNVDVQRHGVIPRVISSIFRMIGERTTADSPYSYSVRCSYVQIYNERVLDLLNSSSVTDADSKGLKLRFNRRNGFFAEGLRVVECTSEEEVMAAWKQGIRNKTMGMNQINIASSRSHALFQLYVDMIDNQMKSEAVTGKFTLVDLAGSERLAGTNASEVAIRESMDINKSLFTLRRVITLLEDPTTKTKSHIPYRDSKLTMLLADSLGGNALTLMIACISPCDNNYEENVSTLEYANRARAIKNEAVTNEDPKTRLIRMLREEVAQLRSQLVALRVGSPETTEAAQEHFNPDAPYRNLRTPSADQMRTSSRGDTPILRVSHPPSSADSTRALSLPNDRLSRQQPLNRTSVQAAHLSQQSSKSAPVISSAATTPSSVPTQAPPMITRTVSGGSMPSADSSESRPTLTKLEQRADKFFQEGKPLAALEALELHFKQTMHHPHRTQQQKDQEFVRLVMLLNSTSKVMLNEGQPQTTRQMLLKADEIISLSEGVISEETCQAMQILTYNNVGCFCNRIGKPATGLKYFNQVLQIEEGSGASTVSTHLNLCATYSQLGRHHKALQEAQMALQLLGEGGDPALRAAAQHSIAVQQEHLGQRAEALDTYRVALRIARRELGPSHVITQRIDQSMQQHFKT